jgi:hypothetical protein
MSNRSIHTLIQTGLILGLLAASVQIARADEPAKTEEAAKKSEGTMPFSNEPDTHQPPEKHFFPLLADKARAHGRELPPAYGVMYVTNWMDSDWRFTHAAVSLSGSPYVNLDAAKNATMDLQVQSNGAKADVWLFPFLDFMVGAGKVDIDAQLGLKDIPISFVPGLGGGTTVRGDKIVPMKFGGDYYSAGGVLAGAYNRFYGACDFSWVKTKLQGDAQMSSSGFWTFTAAPKIGYNAGLSQVYVGARYISKNENFKGTIDVPSGQRVGFDVNVKTDTWVGNFGIRSVIRKHWEILMESALGKRYQITGGIGYRW